LAKALELKPDHIQTRLLMAGIYFRQRDFKLSQKESLEILAISPKNVQAMLILGNSYLYQRKFTEARKTYESIIETAPDNPLGYFRLGYLQRIRGQYEPALKNFEKALSLDPNLMDAFTNVIITHVQRSEFDLAITKCDRQLKQVDQKPEISAMVYNLKGGVYLASQRNAPAEEAFKEAIKVSPNYLKSYYALARIYISENKEDQAIAQYKAALDVNPKQASAHMLLATIYDLQKRFDLSEKHYRAALEVNPNFVAAANNLAYILADQDKDIEEAFNFARLAKEKFPNDPNVMDTLGWVYYRKGLYDNAIGEFTDCLEKMPDNPTVTYHLGMAYYKKGDLENARAELEKALQLDENFSGADEARRILAEL
jgi:tetratricopeptide (TPR) repeat protein